MKKVFFGFIEIKEKRRFQYTLSGLTGLRFTFNLLQGISISMMSPFRMAPMGPPA